MSKAILLILPLIMSMFMAMCVGALVFLPMPTGAPPTGATTADGGSTAVTSGDGSEAVTVLNETGDDCIKFWDHYDQDGTEREYCMRSNENEYSVNNFKAYDFNDRATFVQVGANVNADLYYDSDHRGDPYRIDGPASINLKDTWKNDALSSFKMWRK